MLKANIEHIGAGAKVEVCVSGTGKDVITDVAILINAIYNSYKSEDEDMALAFRLLLTSAIQDPDSSIWTADGDTGSTVTIKLPRDTEKGSI